MIVGAAPQGPEQFALGGLDGKIVDAGKTALHEAVLVELPVFVAVGPVPLAGVVMPFIGIVRPDAIASTGPQFPL